MTNDYPTCCTECRGRTIRSRDISHFLNPLGTNRLGRRKQFQEPVRCLDDADDDDGNLCFHVEVLHALEVLHCKADVVKLYREADLAKIRMSVTRPFKKSLGAKFITKMIFKAIDYHGLQGQLVRNNYENEHRDQIRSIYASCCNMMLKNQSDPSFQYDNDR